jgi:predicted metal-dependent hydrolase
MPDGAVVVTAPTLFGLRSIENFVTTHSDWIRKKVDEARDRIIVRIRKADIPRLKREALALAEERSAHFAALYGVEYNKISIRSQKTRWGSCSKSGNLSFNYKIVALDRKLTDYVIVHEICHLLRFDHSKDFWHLVERSLPDHAVLRREMRKITVVYF